MKGRERVDAVTAEQIVAFGRLTGNDHDMHTSDEAARAMGYPAIVVQGPYLVARAIAESSEFMRGKGIALLEVVWRFTGSAVARQQLDLRWELVGVRRTSKGDRGVADVALRLATDEGDALGEGSIKVLVTGDFADEYERGQGAA